MKFLPVFVPLMLFLSCRSEEPQKMNETEENTSSITEKGGAGCAMCKPEPVNYDSMEIEKVRRF